MDINHETKFYLRTNSIHFQVEYYDIDVAKDAVKRNKVWGLIYFSSNYTASLGERIMLKEEADDITITLSEVNVWQDMSSKLNDHQKFTFTVSYYFEFSSSDLTYIAFS